MPNGDANEAHVGDICKIYPLQKQVNELHEEIMSECMCRVRAEAGVELQRQADVNDDLQKQISELRARVIALEQEGKQIKDERPYVERVGPFAYSCEKCGLMYSPSPTPRPCPRCGWHNNIEYRICVE
jgi:rubrerythrin